jgi:phosphoadenosine phosphosulfate reductase
MLMNPDDIAKLSLEFEQASPDAIITWAIETYRPDIAMSSSFQTQSLPLLHMVTRVYPDIRIFFLETGLHFWETMIFRQQIETDWKLNIVDLHYGERWRNFLKIYGRDLPKEDPNLCCYLRKVEPMQDALQGLKAWITGIRRDQTTARAAAKILEPQPDGLLKINPLLNWSESEVEAYRREHKLPEHPLTVWGYASIGCAPCTRPIRPGESPRAGRWAGTGKTECGLHTEMFRQKVQSPEDLARFKQDNE